jgi:hypothetical protein
MSALISKNGMCFNPRSRQNAGDQKDLSSVLTEDVLLAKHIRPERPMAVAGAQD